MKHLNNILPYLLGIGLAIMPIHRIFSAAIGGLAIILFVSMYVTYMNWKEVRKTPRTLLLLVLTLALLVIFIPGSTMYAKMYIIGMCCVFFASNVLGPKVLTPLGIGAIVGGLSVIVFSIITDFTRTGGIYQVENYNLATGVILIGAVLWRCKWQWVVVTIAMLGALFTGADEAFVIIAVLSLVVLIRRDWSRKILPALAVVIIPIVFLLLPNNPVQKLWDTVPLTIHAVTQQEVILLPQQEADTPRQSKITSDLNNRWNIITSSLKDVKLFGHGYKPDNVETSTIHNVPVRVLWELGPLGLLCWLGLIIWGLLKTSWKYAFVAVIGASLFDHYVWTQLAPYFFVLLGVSMWLPNKKDWIFK